MRYLLDDRYRFRGWKGASTGVFDTIEKKAQFLDKQQYLFLLECDGAHEINPNELDEEKRKAFVEFLEDNLIHPAGFAQYLKPQQKYQLYPSRYKKSAHWSITGECNLNCRHCFMSAPFAKHGAPTHEQIISIADQLVECGIFQVGITGGEPLVRKDMLDIIDELNKREIGISVIFTNGWLLDEKFLDELEKRCMHPAFQLSFDGIGCHDFLRGIAGAEKRALDALKMLQERDYRVSVSMSLHRKNISTIRETVNLMASLGVRSIKCGTMMNLGEWKNPELENLRLTPEEELKAFEEYIPYYFEDDAPLSIMLGGAFMYTPGNPDWRIYNVVECPEEDERSAPSCSIITHDFYIGADGMVCPCMGMADCSYAPNFPNLFKTPLKEILADSDFNNLCQVKIGDIRDHNSKCRQCKYIDRCGGGCRNSALMAGDDYYGIDTNLCWFFENRGDERIKAAAKKPFEAYIRRNPPKKTTTDISCGY